jgi:K+/H+ antiporter YhaU regulatory subunit KhtT
VHGIAVVALHDNLRDEITPIPDPDAILKESDTLLVAGKEDDLLKATRFEAA